MRKILSSYDPSLEMTREEAIDLGKQLVKQRDMEFDYRPSEPLPDRAYEIIGQTGAVSFGRTTLLFFKEWEKSSFKSPVYLRCKNNRLEECTRITLYALHTRLAQHESSEHLPQRNNVRRPAECLCEARKGR